MGKVGHYEWSILNTGYPQFTHTAKEGERGVSLVSRVVNETFGWLFKRNHQEHDFGIDSQIEVITEGGAVTGQLMAAQIKHGKSFFREKNKWGYIFRGELKHFNYLSNYPIPVLIVICHPETEECYWVRFQPEQVQITEAGWKITVPFGNKLSESKAALQALLPPLRDRLSELKAYWALNDLLVESSHILFVIDSKEVNELDVTRPRQFFDRLLATKELAYQCQGKVEISFYGYDSDPRELFEIEAVRQYIALLDEALRELFFFARTEEPASTIRTFAFCLTKAVWEGERSTRTVTRSVVYDTNSAVPFLMRHLLGLNDVTEWLSISIEENKRISLAVARVLGIEPPEDENQAKQWAEQGIGL